MAISNNSTGLRPGVCTSSTRPTAPYEGQMIYETDTDKVLVYNGTAWYANWNTSWGMVAAPVTWSSNSKVVNTANPSVSLASFTFNAVNNRYYKMSWIIDVYQNVGSSIYLQFYVNGSLNTSIWYSNTFMLGSSYVYKATSTGSLTLALYGFHNSGSGSSYFGSVTAPQVVIEDIGPV